LRQPLEPQGMNFQTRMDEVRRAFRNGFFIDPPALERMIGLKGCDAAYQPVASTGR
jgi:hypothetical protein